MTGGRLQAINGVMLVIMFFAVRVCYGIYIVRRPFNYRTNMADPFP